MCKTSIPQYIAMIYNLQRFMIYEGMRFMHLLSLFYSFLYFHFFKDIHENDIHIQVYYLIIHLLIISIYYKCD